MMHDGAVIHDIVTPESPRFLAASRHIDMMMPFRFDYALVIMLSRARVDFRFTARLFRLYQARGESLLIHI